MTSRELTAEQQIQLSSDLINNQHSIPVTIMKYAKCRGYAATIQYCQFWSSKKTHSSTKWTFYDAYKTIAGKLFLSEKTIERHIKKMRVAGFATVTRKRTAVKNDETGETDFKTLNHITIDNIKLNEILYKTMQNDASLNDDMAPDQTDILSVCQTDILSVSIYTDTPTDTPIESKKDVATNNKTFSLSVMLDSNPHDIDKDILEDWVNSRKMKKKVTASVWKLLNKKLDDCLDKGFTAKYAFETMVLSGWASVAPSWLENLKNTTTYKSQDKEGDAYEDETTDWADPNGGFK